MDIFFTILVSIGIAAMLCFGVYAYEYFQTDEYAADLAFVMLMLAGFFAIVDLVGWAVYFAIERMGF